MKKKSLLVWGICLVLLLPITTSAATYHLDAEGGNDTNSGTSPAAAWQSLAHASAQTFAPGDQILLQRGDTFLGTLILDNESGTQAEPIIVGAYGTGDLPVIDAAGYLAGVNIRDVEYIEVQDLEITSNGGPVLDGSAGLAEKDEWNADKARYGVYVNGITGTAVVHVTLRNLYIHDIFPTSDRATEGANPTTYWGYGIKFSGGALPANASGFKDSDGLSEHFLVENCTIERTGHRGIHALRVNFLNIIDNVLTDIGGPGIQPSICDDMVVRGNVVTRSGSYVDPRMHGRGSGIWPWSSERVLIEKNTFSGARGRNDSCGIHIDWNCSHVVVQYNLSIDNAGGFLEILGGTYNNTYRYNISINDGSRKKDVLDQGAKANDKHGYIIWLGGYRGWGNPRGGPTHSYIYNNTIYVADSVVDRAFNIEDTASGALIANNIFYIESGTFNGTTASNNGPYSQSMIDSIVWDNNLYQRTDIIPAFPFAEDPQTIGDPLFANKGGLAAADYIPTAASLIADQGINITTLAGDTVGLEVGLAVTEDYFGNPIVGLPDMGAVEIQVTDPVITYEAGPNGSITGSPPISVSYTDKETDIVNTGGALVSAQNFGGTEAVTINGIVHANSNSALTPASSPGPWGNPDSGTFTGDMFTLLEGIAGSDTGAPSTVTLSGLTPGETYLFQAYWLVKDNFDTRTMNVNLEGETLDGISANTAANEFVRIAYTYTATDDTFVGTFDDPSGNEWLQGFSLQVAMPESSSSIIQEVIYDGNTTAVTATPAAYYSFTDWSDGSTANPRSDANVTSSQTYTANFAAIVTAVNAVPHAWLADQAPSWTSEFETLQVTDHDGDGVTTGVEYWAGTDPNNKDSVLGLVSSVENGVLTLEWNQHNPAAELPDLRLESSTDLLSTPWDLEAVISRTHGVMTWTQTDPLPGAEPRTFYRLVAPKD